MKSSGSSLWLTGGSCVAASRKLHPLPAHGICRNALYCYGIKLKEARLYSVWLALSIFCARSQTIILLGLLPVFAGRVRIVALVLRANKALVGYGMKIWVDADACPNIIKDILFKAATRVNVALTLVANQPLTTPKSPMIRSIVVAQGFDVADNYIVANALHGDLLITADIPLAAEAIAKNVHVISPRGERWTANNIEQRLAMRNFMESMRDAGQATGGPPPLNNSDKTTFANALDRFLTRHLSS